MNRKIIYATVFCALALIIGAQLARAEIRAGSAQAIPSDATRSDSRRDAIRASQQKLAAIRTNREDAMQDIMYRLLPADAAQIDRYQFEVALRKADTRTLLSVSNSWSYEEATKILLFGSATGGESAGVNSASKALGDTTGDYVYTAVPPCRIVDTRPASGGSGLLSGGTSRDFYVYGDGATIGGQGGNVSGCTSPRGEPRAVHVNATVVPTADGFLTVYPTDVATLPVTSLVNYKTGVPIANAGIIQTNYDLVGQELRVYSSKGTHVILDVLGYFHEVSAIDLEPPSMQGTLYTCFQDTTTMVVTVDTSYENQTPFCFSSENQNDMRAVHVSHLWRAGAIVPGTYEIGICGAQGNDGACSDGVGAEPFYLAGQKVTAVVTDAIGDTQIYHSGYDLTNAPSVDTDVPTDHFLSCCGNGSTVVTISAGDTVLVEASGQIHGDPFSSSP